MNLIVVSSLTCDEGLFFRYITMMGKTEMGYNILVEAKKDQIEKISCKRKVSSKPKKDFVILGSFSFKNKKIFIRSFKLMIKKKQKINKEYYMDVVAKNTLLLGYKVGYINVSNYKNFGTPNALKSYE